MLGVFFLLWPYHILSNEKNKANSSKNKVDYSYYYLSRASYSFKNKLQQYMILSQKDNWILFNSCTKRTKWTVVKFIISDNLSAQLIQQKSHLIILFKVKL